MDDYIKDYMDAVIKANDFLDSLFGVVKKLAACAAAACAAVALAASSVWDLVAQRPVQFATCALLLVLIGGLVGAGLTLLLKRRGIRAQLEVRDQRITDLETEVGTLETDHADEVDSLKRDARNAEAASRETLAQRDARIAELEAFKSSHADEMAGKIRALPSAQRAVLWAAYSRDGAFRADGDFSATRGGGDLMALEGMGVIERVEGGARPVWNLALEARREIDGSDELRGALEADHARWSAEMRRRERDRLVEDARRDVAGLGEWGRKMLTDLLIADGPVPIGDRTADNLINHIGKRLVAIETDPRGQLTARATDVAREVVPAWDADGGAGALFNEPTG